MARSLFLVLALASSVAHAALAPVVPSRADIFSILRDARPAISPSGKWIAESAAGGDAITLLPIDKAASGVIAVALPPATRIHWYRWAQDDVDTLLIAVGGDRSASILKYDVATRTLAALTTPADSVANLIAAPINNYAFTFERFVHAPIRRYRQLSRTGELVVVRKNNAAWQRAADGSESFLDIATVDGAIRFTFGVDPASRQTFDLNAGDRRSRGALVSVTPAGRAYVVSANGLDTLGLHELNLQTGTQRIVFSGSVDIRKVILDPVDLAPDLVELDDGGPVIEIINDRVRADIDVLGKTGHGLPTIVDRSPNDRFWIVRYDHDEGMPKWFLYRKENRSLRMLDLHRLAHPAPLGWRARDFRIARAGQPTIRAHVALPGKGICEQAACPVVLNIHGGPGERDYAGFNTEEFWLVSRGVAVVSVNYRGSKGFGSKYESLDKKQWGTGIPGDVRAALAQALDTLPLDRTRVAVIGTSFSGYLALQLAATGTRLRCAVVDSMSTDLVKFAERRFNTFGAASDLIGRLGDTRNAAERGAMQSLSAVAQIGTLKELPLLHFQGDGDTVTWPEDNVQFVSEMKRANPQYTFVRIPGAGHGLMGARPAYRAAVEQFLGRCLGIPVETITENEARGMTDWIVEGDQAVLRGAIR